MSNRHGWEDMNFDRTRGIFGASDASLDPEDIESFDQVKSQASQQGMNYNFACPGCGKRKTFTAEFPELVAIANGVAPQNAFGGGTTWMFDPQHGFYPHMQCTTCGAEMPLLVSSSEAAHHVNAAIKSGMIPQQQVQQLVARVNQVRASNR